MSTFWVEASKEKKAFEEEFDAGFDIIFNYGYDYYAFAHNICESKPDGMSDTSKPLPSEFVINPQYSLGVVLVEVVVALEVGISEGVEHSPAAGAKVGDNPNSLSRVAREREESGVSNES